MYSKNTGTAFFIQDETPAKSQPPRRLQALKGSRRITMDDLITKQRLAEERKHQNYLEKGERLKKETTKTKLKVEQREFEKSQRVFVESEKRMSKVSRNREQRINSKINRVREHNAKVVLRKKSTMRDSTTDNVGLSGKLDHDSDYNKSENESWADNDSIKNIYDQMEFIKPASELVSAIPNNLNQSDEEFYS